jgi:DNA-binding NarL/FixJ family response regulator
MHMLAKMTVLIVDDHPSFRVVAKTVLETDGFAVVGIASDGVSAVDETLRLAPDVVLLDVELPDIDGFEVAARLRQAGSRTAIVLASSRDGSDFGPLVAESGARGFVTKADLTGDVIRALVA